MSVDEAIRYGAELRDLRGRVSTLQLDIGINLADLSAQHLGQVQGALIGAQAALEQAERSLQHGLELASAKGRS